MYHRAQSLTKAKSEILRTDLFLEQLSLQMQIYSSPAIKIFWNRELNAHSYLQQRNLFKGTLNRIDYPKVALYAPDRSTGLIIRAEVYDRRRFRAACAHTHAAQNGAKRDSKRSEGVCAERKARTAGRMARSDIARAHHKSVATQPHTPTFFLLAICPKTP